MSAESRLSAGEHELLKAKHLLNGLCQLLWADDEPDVDVLRTLSDSLWDQMLSAIEQLYPSLSQEQLAALRAEADPLAAYRCGYAAGIRDGSKD